MKLPRRRWLLLAELLASLVVAVPVWRGERPRPCPATFAQVHVGMTRRAVEERLGGPPRVSHESSDGQVFAVWAGGGESLSVRFQNGEVVKLTIEPFPEPTFWERLRARSGL